MLTFPERGEVAVFPEAFESGFFVFGLAVDQRLVFDEQLLNAVADIEQMLLHVGHQLVPVESRTILAQKATLKTKISENWLKARTFSFNADPLNGRIRYILHLFNI